MVRYFNVIALIFLLLMIKPVRNTFGIVEGWFLPVISPLQVTSYSAQPRYMLMAGASEVKWRLGCDYRRVEWHLGAPGASVPVAGGFFDGAAVSSTAWDGIFVEAAPSQLNGLFAYVWHQCPGRWYQTRTLWYNGNKEFSG